MLFDHSSSAGYLANHMARLFFEELRKRIEHLGIVPGQFPALLALWKQNGLTQRELVEQLDIEQATMANTLNRMERDGLILRVEHPTDKRVKIILLGERAKSIRDDAYRAATAVNKMALSELSPREREQFIDYMQRTIHALQNN